MMHYGLDARVADVPETWVVRHVGNARTACLGILMFIFYFQRRYDVLDVFLIVSGGYLGLVDCYILWNEGLRSIRVFRLFAEFFCICCLRAVRFTHPRRSTRGLVLLGRFLAERDHRPERFG
ncbi:hypothetical protein F5Y04DRAFT_241786 [Hypomontagnella monticulosa]|nr:hypothetical protein F5Y04DRAFT_241786 [Hypomontagnella monticulosa]